MTRAIRKFSGFRIFGELLPEKCEKNLKKGCTTEMKYGIIINRSRKLCILKEFGQNSFIYHKAYRFLLYDTGRKGKSRFLCRVERKREMFISEEQKMTNTKILVIDDDPEITVPVKNYFENEGYEVRTASNGIEGITMFRKCEPDLVILDITMPKKDGYQVCREIREMSQKPIIFLSAKTEEFDKVLALELGGDDYVTKPFGYKELSARIKAVLRRCQTHVPQEDEEVIRLDNIEISKQKYELIFWLPMPILYFHGISFSIRFGDLITWETPERWMSMSNACVKSWRECPISGH